MLQFGEALQSLFAGEDTDEACAAAANMAEVFAMLRESLRKKD
jgi:hypothetical protein